MRSIARHGSPLLLALLFTACATTKSSTPATTTTAATLSPDRTALVADLETTRQAFVDSVKGLSEAQLRFKAAPDRWSVAETAEHIAVAEERILANVSGKITQAPLTDELRAKIKPDDARIHRLVTDRTNKRQAPEVLRPTGRFPSLNDVMTTFAGGRSKTVEYARTTPADLRAHAAEHPALGVLDAHQWLLFLSAHSARHTAQILEVKADPAFPK